MSAVSYFKKAMEMTTSPGDLLELTTIKRDGVDVKAFAHAPGTTRDLWALASGHGDAEYLVYQDERYTYNDYSLLILFVVLLSLFYI